MNLNDWNKIRKGRKDKYENELTDRQIEAGISNNPADYYFAVFVDPEYSSDYVDGEFVDKPRTCATICPRKYFDETGGCWDQHLLDFVKIPGFAEDMEAMISPAAHAPELEPAEMHELLTDIGLVWSEKFADFCNKHDPGYDTVYFPEKT